MDELTKILGKVAPWIAAGAAGPAGLAAMALKTAAQALGASDESVAAVATAAVGASPEQLQALQAAERDWQLRMQALGFDSLQAMESLAVADRKDARARDTALAAAGRRNTRADIMVAIDALGLVVCLVLLGVYRASLPGEVVALISTIASIFGLCLRDAHQFEFGSSRGSRDKDEWMALQPPGRR